MTIASDIRVQLLGEDDSDTLSDTYITLMLEDAKGLTGITDETSRALRFYSCYLIAQNWESIGAVASREGVQYRKPDPYKYMDLYNKAIELTLTDGSCLVAAKESTTEGNIFADNGVMEKGDYDDSSN